MGMTNKEKFAMILQQRENENYLFKERNAEEEYLFLITMNKKDVCTSEEAIGENGLFKSITSHMARWYKQIEDNTEKTETFLICSIEETLNKFRDYIVDKLKGDKLKDFELAWNNHDFKNDVRNLLVYKAFEHKGEMKKKGGVGFLSPKAGRNFSLLTIQKSNRNFMHEGYNRGSKILMNTLEENNVNLTNENIEKILKTSKEAFFASGISMLGADEKYLPVVKDNLLEDKETA